MCRSSVFLQTAYNGQRITKSTGFFCFDALKLFWLVVTAEYIDTKVDKASSHVTCQNIKVIHQ